ncbi:FUSC family protein [Mycetocola miduiensis]|uniref:Uncharacterized membrane protein YgaE, UPF0421/DUF939 family n=1 Tax=Mycetocola miduiensis TaxID=995034 RepID=A0A1I5CS02_9MICO|nr:aromatic acid exporter family protein [Mycetocola miduiensis]SFN89712.1 Uncharacterized membrane protein YgaE, UPF0421/DUF939 family [Mycetocola miduiensis]
MAARIRWRGARPRWNPRQLLWWLWPELPASWSQVPERLLPAVTQIARLTIAAVVAYVIADALFPGILDLTAPLTALLVVQVSTVGTLLMGLVRVGAVLTGVLVAVAVTTFLGLTWWSLALVMAASLTIAYLLRLGDQTLEAPISGMLILAVSAPGVAAEVRVANTLIGTAVGVAFSLIAPIAIPNARASQAVRRVIRSQAALLNEVASTLGDRAPHPEEVTAWTEWIGDIAAELRAAAAAVEAARESRRLNPRALATATVHPGLASAVGRLDRSLAAERILIAAIGRQAPVHSGSSSGPLEAELRRAFAVALDDVANSLRAFGDLVQAEYEDAKADRSEEAFERTLEAVREARAVITELALIDVDPRGQAELWILHSSVLAALEQVVAQLDVDVDVARTGRRTEPWVARRLLPMIRLPRASRPDHRKPKGLGPNR